jgi:NADH-quinone oxidoreductase subunit N
MNLSIGLADVFKVSPLIALFLASLIPITIKVLRGNKEQSSEASLIQAMGGIIAALLLHLTVYVLVHDSKSPTAFANAVVVDGVSLWVGGLALVCAAVSIVLAYENRATVGKQFSELIFLTLNSVVGMLVLVSAVDLLVVFIGLETMSLALYLMIGISNEQKLAKESAFKYFVLGSFASAIFLYGISFIFGTVGSTYISDLIQQSGSLIVSNKLFLIGTSLVTLGFLFKVSIVPFHAWTADVYQGAPTPHTALMATAVKAVSFAAFLRVISAKALVGSEALFETLQWLAVITMIVGNTAALIQNNFKRMLAYSSIAHSGYLLVGLITAGVSDDMSFGASGVIFYLIGYSIMSLGCFALVSYMEKSENSQISIDSLSGYAAKNPIMALSLSVLLLSLAGIPPTLGFFGKFYLFSAAISEGLLWLAVWGVLNSVISVYYYLRPIVVMYMKDDACEEPTHQIISSKAALAISAVVIVLLGVLSGPVFQALEKAL